MPMGSRGGPSTTGRSTKKSSGSQENPHLAISTLSLLFDHGMFLQYADLLDQDPDNSIHGLLFSGLECPRVINRTTRKPVFPTFTDLAPNQSSDLLILATQWLNGAGWAVDAADLVHNSSSIAKRLRAHKRPELSFELGDILSDDSRISIYLPLHDPVQPGLSNGHPAGQPVMIGTPFYTSDQELLSGLFLCRITPVYSYYTDRM